MLSRATAATANALRLRATTTVSANKFPIQTRSFATGVKLLKQRGKASEDLYFSQEDEKLLKKLLEANPNAGDDAFGCIQGDNIEEKVKLVFLKHGIPPLNKELIRDICGVLESK